MLGVLRFWLERGVDGFRVDVLWHLVKDHDFADNPPNPAWREGMDPYNALVPLQTTDRPEVHDIVLAMRKLLDAYPERVLIGEIYLPLERLVAYYGADPNGESTGRTCLSTSSSCRRPGTQHTSRRSSPSTSACSPRARGPTGCSATTTGRASPRASGRRRRASRRCCSSRCAARRRSTTATSSACRTCRSRPSACRTRSSAGCRGWAWAATRCARQCSGAPSPTPASPRVSRGCRSPQAGAKSTSPRRRATRLPCCRSTSSSSPCAAARAHWKSAASRRSRPRRACSRTCAATPSSWRST